MDNSHVVALFSGGLDSGVLLWHLCRNWYRRIDLLAVNYGQNNVKELQYAYALLESARLIFPEVEITLEVAHINLDVLLSGNAMTGKALVPQAHYRDEATKRIIVPVRNLIFLSIAWSLAIDHGAAAVAAGLYAEGDETTLFLDTTPTFARFFQRAACSGDVWKPDLKLPFMGYTKQDVIQQGYALMAPMGLTWSCYNNERLHCGRCPACIKRKEAFELAAVEDTTLYAV